MPKNSRRTFGSGLESVLNVASLSMEALKSDSNKSQELKQLMVHQMIPGKYQPRQDFDQGALKELSESISKHGILQPILVRKSALNEYEIIAGERRWRAAQLAGLQQVPVLICNITNESALAFGIIENIQRKDLNPLEEAFALKRLIDEFEMTHEQVAQSVGRSRAQITNTLRLLNLTKPVQELLVAQKIEVGHAKLLLVFTPEKQEEIAQLIINRKLTVRATEILVHSKKTNSVVTEKPLHQKCGEWSRALTRKFSSTVQVKIDEAGFGKVIIHVNSLDQIEFLMDM